MITSILSFVLASCIASTPVIKVVYPRIMPGDTICYIANVDSNFIFGSVEPPEAEFTIDGFPVEKESGGEFIAFLPVNWTNSAYTLVATHEGDTVRQALRFTQREVIAVPKLPPNITFPCVLRLEGRVARTDPLGAYYIFPSPGTLCLATAWSKGYFELPLGGSGRTAWIDESYVDEILDVDKLDSPSIWNGEVRESARSADLRLQVGKALIYRVWENADNTCIYVELYNAVSHIDRIRYDPDVSPIRDITWDQSAPGIITLEISLSEPAWGYNVDWDDGDFVLSVRKPPHFKRGIKDLRIVLDPGHGGDQFGAVGPSGLKEKDANLKLALELARLLERRGADVILTRDRDVDVGLGKRIEIADSVKADILISLHHNALPDGVNPFGKLGTGTNYYYPQSRDLADYVQREVVKTLGIPDEGVYYHNLALVRATGMPSILLESAYIMLPEHEKLISEEGYNERLARAIYKGLKCFVKARKG